MSQMFSKAPPQVTPPAPVEPPPMPDPQSPAALEAGRKAAADAAMRMGRTGTALTTPSRGTIAGGAYQSAVLGGK